jgi:hypothetical protein
MDPLQFSNIAADADVNTSTSRRLIGCFVPKSFFFRGNQMLSAMKRHVVVKMFLFHLHQVLRKISITEVKDFYVEIKVKLSREVLSGVCEQRMRNRDGGAEIIEICT